MRIHSNEVMKRSCGGGGEAAMLMFWGCMSRNQHPALARRALSQVPMRLQCYKSPLPEQSYTLLCTLLPALWLASEALIEHTQLHVLLRPSTNSHHLPAGAATQCSHVCHMVPCWVSQHVLRAIETGFVCIFLS